MADASSQVRDSVIASEDVKIEAEEKGHLFPQLEPERAARLTVPFDDHNKISSILAEHGMAIVTGVASPEECLELELEFGRDLIDLFNTKNLRGISELCDRACDEIEKHRAEGGDQTDPAFLQKLVRTWPIGSKIGYGPLAIECGLPQGRFAWRARHNSNVRKVYSTLHGKDSDELCVSLDTVFFSPPSLPFRKKSSVLWPHVDQNSHSDPSGKWDIFQSILYTWPSDVDGASTTLVWPGSQVVHFERIMKDELMQAAGNMHEHYSAISKMKDRESAAELDESFNKMGRRIPIPQGGLLVWSSRTIHQGHLGGRRLAMPLCWEPKERRDEEALKRKSRLSVVGMASTHWASLGFQHGVNNLEPQVAKHSDAEHLNVWAKELLDTHVSPPDLCSYSSEYGPASSDITLPLKLRLPALACCDADKKEATALLQRKLWRDATNFFLTVEGDAEITKQIEEALHPDALSIL